MTAIAILTSLNAFPNIKDQSYGAAQAGFLEWVFALPVTTCPRRAAQQALDDLTDRAATSQAGIYFYDFLKQAACADRRPVGRRGGRNARRATLH